VAWRRLLVARDGRRTRAITYTRPLNVDDTRRSSSDRLEDVRRESRFFHTPPAFDARVNSNSFE